ncbi:putative TetR family transcriptional regulator [Gordonia effusa NBRC 100432]|uniref:Putative TetR family transcriptional regulator n=1 Tax=Gordonia effusa NBRC 100432 TaxID=1077974 RepID=H0R0H5_9ACTN|nr:TetR family transcriptional regulator [Gordonia effusa]GAB18576.1 putative TetR family transcriptional regulator [Gordonia effusa NBRC 100432]
MPPQPAARVKVLYAYAEILVESGERAATLDAVASRAAVSKGGLLYHFASKSALADGLAELLDELVAEDVVAMRAAPDGPIDYLLRTSHHLDERFELIYQAVTRLAMGSHTRAKAAIESAYARWQQELVDVGADRAVAATILLIADGLSVRSTAFGPDGSAGLGGVAIDEIVAVAREIDRIRR